jgi:hypothetical protein
MRKFGILAGVGLTFLVLAGAASADTILRVPLSFNNAVLGTAAGDLVVASPATPPITAVAQVDETNDTFTITPDAISFPTASFTTPIPGTATIALGSPATGQLNLATGQLVLSADFHATVAVTGLGSCEVDTGTQTFSTDQTNLYAGRRFPITPDGSGFVTGAGAISGGWTSLTNTAGPACALLGSALGGGGSLWISRNVPPPTTAPIVRVVSLGAKPDGATSLRATVSAPGEIDVMASAWLDNFPRGLTAAVARTRDPLQPALGRFVFARAHASATHAGTVDLSVLPNADGMRLLQHHRYRVTLRLWVAYQPVEAMSQMIGYYGLHLGGSCPSLTSTGRSTKARCL